MEHYHYCMEPICLFFPIFLKLTGRHCLVVGAGNIAESKISSLLHAQAQLTVALRPRLCQALPSKRVRGSFCGNNASLRLKTLKGYFPCCRGYLFSGSKSTGIFTC